ncbi:uncharacterized protein LOC143195002 [Rhynchophorus ferrugineus]|uniref:uncharacterized protein LOC143195002 n=1 Tax=Rhynchophorus ferrugineus TaxID=354439 RepID=UPI003FCE747B
MRWISLLPFLLLPLLCQADDQQVNKEESVTSTEASSNESSNLNTNLRSALLEALSELENDTEDNNENPYSISDANVKSVHTNNIAVYSGDTNKDDGGQSQNKEGTRKHTISNELDQLLPSRNDVKKPSLLLDPPELIESSSSNNIAETTKLKNTNQKISRGNALNAISISEFDKVSKTLTSQKIDPVKGETQSRNIETTTVPVIRSSTEESEAKVEQVQFFSAPLVAAFTVHQDEQGQPKKVEPIFKNAVNHTNELPQQPFLQSDFNNYDIQKKQQILELELARLRKQQVDNLEQINRFQLPSTDLNNQVNYHALVQNGFNQGKTQHFKQLEPVFTEPDRSIITKLATVDPQSLLNQNTVSILNKFDSRRLTSNNIQSNSAKNTVDISLLPSISFNPIVEARNNLPLVQPFLSLPKIEKEAKFKQNQFDGFHSGINEQQNLITLQQQKQNIQPSAGLVPPNLANPIFTNNFQNLNFNKNDQNQNRFLRQEPNSATGQASFSILPSTELFGPKHEISLVRNNDLFGRNPIQSNNHNQNARFNQNVNSINNNNRFLRSNLEGAHTRFTIQPSIQPFENNIFHSPVQNTRVFRSNPESTFRNNQNDIPIGLVPPRIPYYFNNFGSRN